MTIVLLRILKGVEWLEPALLAAVATPPGLARTPVTRAQLVNDGVITVKLIFPYAAVPPLSSDLWWLFRLTGLLCLLANMLPHLA